MYPRWRGDGKELFLLSADGTMMAARIDVTNGSSLGVQPLFPTQLRAGNSRPYLEEPWREKPPFSRVPRLRPLRSRFPAVRRKPADNLPPRLAMA